jgi:putative ABC transport system ATP-binding protein
VPEASLSVEEVTAYGTGPAAVRALDRVSLEFEPGRLALVTGPSGSGKTTLLSVLGGLLTPTSGTLRAGSREMGGLSSEERSAWRRRDVGYVFQAFRLFRALTALENVLVALEIAGRRGRRARDAARAALEAVGLGAKAEVKPNALSGGEKQRVAIARALVHEPSIVLADEPTASLPSGERIGELLQALAERDGRLVVVVSHDPRLAASSHRTVTLADGRLVADTEAPCVH